MPRVKGDRDETFSFKNNKKMQIEQDPIAVRVGGRTKKAKIVFDPSENNMPKKRLSRSFTICSDRSFFEKSSDALKNKKPKLQPPPTIDLDNDKRYRQGESALTREPQLDGCYICSKVEKRNRKLIGCKECEYKVHPNCLKINFQNQTLLETNWRCNDCTTCIVCYETSESGNIVTCCICVESYHIKCITPKALQKNINKLKWECLKCQNISTGVTNDETQICDEEGNLDENECSPSQLKKKNSFDLDNKSNGSLLNITTKKDASPVNQQETGQSTAQLARETIQNWMKLDEEIPDVTNWSCEEVTNYIKKYFPAEAKLFQEQQIDGACLMLMKRSDVMQLPIKLGPAIRLYSLIARIQSSSNDPRITWM